MPYDYKQYMKDYRKKNLVTVTVVFNKEKDEDILREIETENKSGTIKELIRKGMKV